jgi:hypothetical protein
VALEHVTGKAAQRFVLAERRMDRGIRAALAGRSIDRLGI